MTAETPPQRESRMVRELNKRVLRLEARMNYLIGIGIGTGSVAIVNLIANVTQGIGAQ